MKRSLMLLLVSLAAVVCFYAQGNYEIQVETGLYIFSGANPDRQYTL